MPTKKKAEPLEGEITETAITVQETNPREVIQLVGDLDSIVSAFQQYQKAVEKLLTKEDYQKIGGGNFKKKSAWRKLSTAFGITTQVVDKTIAYDDNGKIHHAEFVVRATAPNGRFAEAWAGASVIDRKFSHDQDVAATAQTRATNRAISDLIGAGEVSAEEAEGGNNDRAYDDNRNVSTQTGEITIKNPEEPASEAQVKSIPSMLKSKGITSGAQIKALIHMVAKTDVSAYNKLTKQQASDIIKYLMESKAEDIQNALTTETLGGQPVAEDEEPF